MSTFYSHGKLLLSAEYIVLNGGLALALPTSLGQSLEIFSSTSGTLSWESRDPDGIWFSAEFSITGEQDDGGTEITFDPSKVENPEIARTLVNILRAAINLNPGFLNYKAGFHINTTLEFPRNWGLGSSSTLINNIALWAGIDPYRLLWDTVGGSGYDIACANADRPVLYQLKNGKPLIEKVSYYPSFSGSLYFVYLNKKALSNEAVAKYESLNFDQKRVAGEISVITKSMVTCDSLERFNQLIDEHESIISGILNQPTVKSVLFGDFEGSIKSLGAWGGDFILATGNDTTPTYFKARGYEIVIPYQQLILPE